MISIISTGMKLNCTQQDRQGRETSDNKTMTYERATKFRREIQMCICLNFVLIPAAVGCTRVELRLYLQAKRGDFRPFFVPNGSVVPIYGGFALYEAETARHRIKRLNTV